MTPPGPFWQNDWPFPKWPAQNALNLNMKKTHTSSKSSLRSSKPTLLYSSQGLWQGSQWGFEVSVRRGCMQKWLALAQREVNVQADLWGNSVGAHHEVSSSGWTDSGPLLLLAGTDIVIVFPLGIISIVFPRDTCGWIGAYQRFGREDWQCVQMIDREPQPTV